MSSFRSIAIIAHVDHGKTTLVDALLKQGGAFAAHEQEQSGVLLMDSGDQEKERGITITAKNAAIMINGERVNLVDTPGHADFGSEVERILKTVDCVLLLVDAQEGPMPQTKFVLKKSLELGIRPIVVINKIDKPAARPEKVIDIVFDLFGVLGATNEQLDFPVVYAIAREGLAKRNLTDDSKDLKPLFDLILSHVTPKVRSSDVPFRMQPAMLGYDSFVGRLATGRVEEGTASVGDTVFIKAAGKEMRRARITKIYHQEGMRKIEITKALPGDIVSIAGIADITVGETITTDENAELLPALTIDPPTVQMTFMVNNSPFAGKEGKLLTTRHIRDRLMKECETNVGLKFEDIPNSDSYQVSGRGELHLSVLIEQMRREGFELQLSRPEVIMQGDLEPIEHVMIDVPEEMSGVIIDLLSKRKGLMSDMRVTDGHARMEFTVPTRGLLGFRGEFIIQTRGEGILNHAFLRFEEYKGSIPGRMNGAMIAMVGGSATAFDLWNLEERGRLFIVPGTNVYEGMIVGESSKDQDLNVNVIRGKKLTNMRASGSDDAVSLTPVRLMSLEEALEYIDSDELVEVSPVSIRLRKKILNENERKRTKKD